MKLSWRKIEAAMLKGGLSQAEIAARMGITQPSVSELFGKIKMGVELLPRTAFKIAKGLGVEPEELAGPVRKFRKPARQRATAKS